GLSVGVLAALVMMIHESLPVRVGGGEGFENVRNKAQLFFAFLEIGRHLGREFPRRKPKRCDLDVVLGTIVRRSRRLGVSEHWRASGGDRSLFGRVLRGF